MTDPLGLRTGPVTAWLGSLRLGIEPPLTFTPLGNGKSNLVYAVTDATGARWVLRRPPLGPLAPSAHDVAREHRILAGLGPDGPAPTALALCTDPLVTDAPLVLLEHVDGIVLDTAEVADATTPEWRERAGLSMARALARVHATDLDATGLTTLAKHDAYAERQLRRWSRQWDDLETRDAPLVTELAARLGATVPPQREVALVHGDYHLRNVIFDAESGDVRAIVDWELCTLGDPLADLGGLLAYWPRPGDAPAVPSGLSVLDGFPERDALVDEYVAASGRDADAIGFWQALAYWKIAVIIEGVRLRAERRGQTPAYDAVFVDGLLERAKQTADAAGLVPAR